MRKLLLLPLLALGLAAAAPAGADDFTATISASGFPPLIKIQNGDRVVWKNDDRVNRQIVADDNSWRSPVIKPGGTWSRIFVEPGTYTYHGAFKPGQHAAIDVSATRGVLIRRRLASVVFGHAFQLSGSISKVGANDETVIIQAQAAGTHTFREVRRVSTENGFWKAELKPRRTTVYRAVWQNVPSSPYKMRVLPVLRLKQVGRGHFSVGVLAGVRLVHHRVLIQRWNKRRHVWSSFTSLRLSHSKYTKSIYNSIGSIRLRMRHGTIIRALITSRQAAPFMGGPAHSRALRV